jgi:hypothetical protein
MPEASARLGDDADAEKTRRADPKEFSNRL